MNNRKGLFLGETQILSELCDSITDCHHSTPKWTDSGKLVIRNFNIKKGRLSLTDPSFTNDETYNALEPLNEIVDAKDKIGDFESKFTEYKSSRNTWLGGRIRKCIF
jgi:hypothetical protein